MVYRKVMETVKRHNLIEKGDKIIVALSGGPDSVCLLHVLNRMSEELGIELYAGHLNHRLRGLDAHLDALYVENLCEELEIPCFIKSVDVNGYCRENRLGVEDGARKLRYEMFDEIKSFVGANKVAIGHNENDQAETVLMKIMRGAGLNGLRGIDYKRKDGIIRPILDLKRDEIEKYCYDNHLNPRIDKTNLEAVYSRNKIRLKILPYMKEEFNENIVESIVRMSNSVREDLDYIENQVISEYDKSVMKYNDGVYILIDYIKNQHAAIKTRVVMKAAREFLNSAGKGNTTLEKKHIDDILELMDDNKLYKKINLPGGAFVHRKGDYLLITSQSTVLKEDAPDFEYEFAPGENVFIPEIGKTVYSKIIDISQFRKNEIKKEIQYFDFDKINSDLKLRNRRQGDKIKLLGGTKKVKDLFIGEKIPREERSFIPIIVKGDEIISIYGLRINSNYRVGEKTVKVLEIEVK